MKKIGNSKVAMQVSPLLPGEKYQRQLVDLASELLTQAGVLAAKLHPIVQKNIGHLMTEMNCYYSNLIEGHDTHPRDIGRALVDEFSLNHKQRALQYEAKAHIAVQRCIDNDTIPFPVMSPRFICWLHQQFCEQLPDELLWVTNRDSQERIPVIPGELRSGWVQVGPHIPPAASNLPILLQHITEGYELSRYDKIQQIIVAAASHHRLLWMHPFFDGNGRVARLFSHAVLKAIGVGAPHWSLARGFARHNEAYKTNLGCADELEKHYANGKVCLSEQGLVRFCTFFLRTAIEQVQDMHDLLEPATLSQRMEYYANSGRLPKGSWPLLREALLMGEFSRGKAAMLTGYKERQARHILGQLVQRGLLYSETPKGPVRLGFPVEVVDAWFPKLYPMGV